MLLARIINRFISATNKSVTFKVMGVALSTSLHSFSSALPHSVANSLLIKKD